VSDFDDFLKKTGDEITKAKADAKVRDDAERERRLKLQALVQVEWPTIMPTMRSITNGKKLGDLGFFEYGNNGMILGGSVVSLAAKRKEYETLRYLAIFKTDHNDPKEDELVLTPTLVEDKLQWSVSGWTATGVTNTVSTPELASALVKKLVVECKANQLA
jgi:hypothetical protein